MSPAQLAGFQDEEDEAQEGCPRWLAARKSGSISRGLSDAGGGSLITAILKPTPVKASVIAGNGRVQNVMLALWPPCVHSSVQLRVSK